MDPVGQKHQIILEHEQKFADRLALQVLDRPKLNVWMILIPIIFVHYFYRMQRFNSGRIAFAENFMIIRKRALDEALDAVQNEKSAKVDRSAWLLKLPEALHGPNLKMLELLVSHYTDLMRSEGESIEALIRSAYQTRIQYLLFVNELNQAEKVLNSALKPYLATSLERVDDIISAMETASEKLRRNHAETVFP
ncbi:MAG: NF038143 family protein [Thermodesulfobacteriota bacterium]